MTISSTGNARVVYVGNGSTTVFAYPFQIKAASQIIVKVDAVTKTLGADYTVSDVGDVGGDVTFSVAPASGADVVIAINMPFTQGIDYTENDSFPAETHERGLDERVLESQQLKDLLKRAAKLEDNTTVSDLYLTNPIAGRAVVWNATADGLTSAELSQVSPVPSNTLMYPLSAVSIPNNTLTVVPLDFAERDIPGYANTTLGRIVLGVSGWVSFKASVEWEAFASSYRFFGVRKNGSGYLTKFEQADDTGTLNLQAQCVSPMKFLNAGDYLELVAMQVSGASRNLLAAGTTWLEATWHS